MPDSYSETTGSIWFYLVMAALAVSCIVSAAIVVRRRPRGLALAWFALGTCVALCLAGYLTMSEAVAHVESRSIICGPASEAAATHGVPTDATMSPVDHACRAAGLSRLALGSLTLLAIPAAAIVVARRRTRAGMTIQ